MSARPIVVYDGVCYLCNRSVNFIIRNQAKQDSFFFVPFQSAQGRLICTHFGLPADDMSTFLLVERSVISTKSTAWLAIMERLSTGWRGFAAILKFVPKAIRDYCYDFVGRHRYRWFGQSEVCLLRNPQDGDAVPDLVTIEKLLRAAPGNQQA